VPITSPKSTKITFILLHQALSECYFFVGTDNGIVELWKAIQGQYILMTNIIVPTLGPINNMVFDPPLGSSRQNGALFVSVSRFEFENIHLLAAIHKLQLQHLILQIPMTLLPR
jgi:hypothetical protein